MTFALTVVYLAMSLLSPGAFPDWMREVPFIFILGILTSIATIFSAMQERLIFVPEIYCVSGVLVAATLSIVATGWLGGAASAFAGFVPVIFSFYFVCVSCRTIWHIKCLTLVLFVVSSFIILQGILAEMGGDITSGYLLIETIAGKPDIYRHRGLGVLADPNDLGLLLVTVLPLMWMFWKKKRGLNNLIFTIIPSFVLIAGIYYTHSRGGAIALLAVVFYGFKDRLGIALSSMLGGLMAVGVFALNFTGGRALNDDDGGRVALWSQALETFKAHPLFGIGMSKFGDYSDNGLTAHNSYVLCLAELGIFGYFFWMGTIVSSWNGLAEIVKASLPNDAEADKKEGANEYSNPRASERSFPIMSAQRSDSAVVEKSLPGFAMEMKEGKEEKEDGLLGAVKCSKAAFVGLLVSAFFLSRTYSVVFYILFGIAAALQTIYRRQHPEVSISFGRFLKSVTVILAASILGLYLFVRFRGSH